ncbi:MAG: cob(I)yrinic acid a,c-diamide adenosyltransferase [Armatimonadota bacterium]
MTGLVQVYTGNSKGKTTAAFGLALRAVGRGLRVAVVQFLKAPTSGERVAARRLEPELSIFGETRSYNACKDQENCPGLREDTEANFRIASQVVRSGEYDLVVLDEINVALHYGFVSRPEMERLLDERPPSVEIVCTGRYAPDWLRERADLVTEMTEIKHPSAQGIAARKGIEF